MMSRFHAIAYAAIVISLWGCGGNHPRPVRTQSRVAEPFEARGESDGAASFYTVSEYDPAANPAEDLAATVSRASASDQRIILEIGGQW